LTGTVTFAPGDDSETFEVTVVGDDINEPTEYFTVGNLRPSGRPSATPRPRA